MEHTLFASLNQMRLENRLCDILLETDDGGRFCAHKLVLAGCSPYFRSLYTRWDDSTHHSIIAGIQADILALIIDYAYTLKTNISLHNVFDTFHAADLLMVSGMAEDCCNFMAENLTSDNCIVIFLNADSRNYQHLKKISYRYIKDHFVEIMKKNQELLELNIEQLYYLLSDDTLNISNEMVVWNVSVEWIQHNATDRMQFIPLLLSCVRIDLLNTTYIRELCFHPYIINDSQCYRVISNQMRFKNKDEPSFIRPRYPREFLLVLGGGIRGNNSINAEMYDYAADMWSDAPYAYLPQPLSFHACTIIGSFIFIVGGFDGYRCLNTCYRLDITQKVWQEVAPMNERRCYITLTNLDDLLYVMGGEDEREQLPTAEVYVTAKNQWYKLESMNESRSDASSASLHNKIYVAGGFNGVEYLSSVECYIPKTKQWTIINPMNYPRKGCRCLSYRNQLYVLGGFNGKDELSSVEMWDPLSQTWQFKTHMSYRRSNFIAEVVNDKIYVVGGFRGLETLNHVECYSFLTEKWHEMSPSYISSAGMACVKLTDPTYIEMYIPQWRKISQQRLQFVTDGTFKHAENKR